MTGKIIVSSVPVTRGVGIAQARDVTPPECPRVADLSYWAVVSWNRSFTTRPARGV